jgi:hypothetical protein
MNKFNNLDVSMVRQIVKSELPDCDEETLRTIMDDYFIIIAFYKSYMRNFRYLTKLIQHIYHYHIKYHAKSLYYLELFVKHSKFRHPYSNLGDFYIHCDSGFKDIRKGLNSYIQGYKKGESKCLTRLPSAFDTYCDDEMTIKYYTKIGDRYGFIECHKHLKLYYNKLYKITSDDMYLEKSACCQKLIQLH